MSEIEITTNDMSEEPDDAQLTVEQLEAVAAGIFFDIVVSGDVFEVLRNGTVVVFTTDSYEEAQAYCLDNLYH
jgi:hypothetical protein